MILLRAQEFGIDVQLLYRIVPDQVVKAADFIAEPKHLRQFGLVMFDIQNEHGLLVMDVSTDLIQGHLDIRDESANLPLLVVEALFDTVHLCCITSTFDMRRRLFHFKRLNVFFETSYAGLNSTNVTEQVSLKLLPLY